MGYGPWSCKESDSTERPALSFSFNQTKTQLKNHKMTEYCLRLGCLDTCDCNLGKKTVEAFREKIASRNVLGFVPALTPGSLISLEQNHTTIAYIICSSFLGLFLCIEKPGVNHKQVKI